MAENGLKFGELELTHLCSSYNDVDGLNKLKMIYKGLFLLKLKVFEHEIIAKIVHDLI